VTIPAAAQTWRPSVLGKRFTKSRDWLLSLNGPELTISIDSEPVARNVGSFGRLTVTPGRVWAHLELEHPDRRFRFRGIANRRAASFSTAFTAAQADAEHALKLLQLVDEFDQAADQVRLFTEALATAVAVQFRARGWLTTEFSAYWAARKAAVGFGQLIDDPELQPHIAALSAVSRETVEIWR
jgi:DNA helicase-4